MSTDKSRAAENKMVCPSARPVCQWHNQEKDGGGVNSTK